MSRNTAYTSAKARRKKKNSSDCGCNVPGAAGVAGNGCDVAQARVRRLEGEVRLLRQGQAVRQSKSLQTTARIAELKKVYDLQLEEMAAAQAMLDAAKQGLGISESRGVNQRVTS